MITFSNDNSPLEYRAVGIEFEAILVIGVVTEKHCSCAVLTFRRISIDMDVENKALYLQKHSISQSYSQYVD